MFTNKARFLVSGVFLILLIFFVYQHTFELAGVVLVFIVLLIWGYFKEGPIILAAKQFHQKKYARAEQLLCQIKRPAWLSKKRRGFYEFIMGGICLQKQDYTAAEKHYEYAAQYPLRTVNDHVAALVHVANLSIRHGNIDKAMIYFQMAKAKEDQVTAKMKSVIEKIGEELNKHIK
mgnify:CR=1 FL=1